MRVLVVGAGGGLGRALIAQLILGGHTVTAFSRHPPSGFGPHVGVITGDAADPEAVTRTAFGHDALVNTIGSGTLRRNTIESDTTATVLAGAQRAGIRRYVGISAGMVTPVSPVFDHLIRPLMFANLYREHLAVEALIRASDLDWTIVRPTKLSNKQPAGYLEANTIRPRGPIAVSRADVASFITGELTTNHYIRDAVFIVSRPTPHGHHSQGR